MIILGWIGAGITLVMDLIKLVLGIKKIEEEYKKDQQK